MFLYLLLYCVLLLFITFMLRCCGDCTFSASVSHVAGEGMELTVHKESVVVEKRKEVEMRHCRVQFIYDRLIIIDTWNLMKSKCIHSGSSLQNLKQDIGGNDPSK